MLAGCFRSSSWQNNLIKMYQIQAGLAQYDSLPIHQGLSSEWHWVRLEHPFYSCPVLRVDTGCIPFSLSGRKRWLRAVY